MAWPFSDIKCIILLHMSLYTLKTNDLTYWSTFATLCYIRFTYWMCLWMIWTVLSIINVLLSGVPDLCDRTKIPRCADLPHLHVPDSVWVFFYFVWFLFIHLNIYFYFESCTYCSNFYIYLLWNMNKLTGVSLLWTRRALANKVKIRLMWK